MRLLLLFSLISSLAFGQEKLVLEEPQKRDALRHSLNMASDQMENDPQVALEYLMEAKELALSLKDTVMLAETHRIWGTIHYYLDDNINALKQWNVAKDYAFASKDSVVIAGVLNNLGNVYSDLKPDSAIFFYRLTQKYINAEEDSLFMGMIYSNLSFSYYDEFNLLDSAEFYGLKAIEVYSALNDKEGIGSMNAQMARVLVDKNQPNEAVVYAQHAIEIGREIGYKRIEHYGMDALHMAQFKLGKSRLAYNTLLSMVELVDSLDNEENMAMVLQMEKDHELEAADAEIQILNAENGKAEAELRQQNILILSSAIGLALMILMFVSISRGKKRSDELLLNILPFETAQELKSTGKAEAKRLEDVTVLFTDFKGFTFMSEKLTPERLVEEIDFCFSEFDRIIERHGIEKIKTIGDSYMAAGGVPSPKDSHAHDVVRAAMEIRDFIVRIAEEKKTKHEPYFDIRIGVSSGPLVAGIVGIKKFQYDIWGDTVNTASRMESAGEVGKVNISQSTYELVKNDFNCVHRGKVEAKGKGEIDMYFVNRS